MLSVGLHGKRPPVHEPLPFEDPAQRVSTASIEISWTSGRRCGGRMGRRAVRERENSASTGKIAEGALGIEVGSHLGILVKPSRVLMMSCK